MQGCVEAMGGDRSFGVHRSRFVAKGFKPRSHIMSRSCRRHAALGERSSTSLANLETMSGRSLPEWEERRAAAMPTRIRLWTGTRPAGQGDYGAGTETFSNRLWLCSLVVEAQTSRWPTAETQSSHMLWCSLSRVAKYFTMVGTDISDAESKLANGSLRNPVVFAGEQTSSQIVQPQGGPNTGTMVLYMEVRLVAVDKIAKHVTDPM